MKQHIFKTVIFLMAAAASVAIHAQTSTQNYVKTETFINGNGGKVTTVQYCDGLGRPVLTATDGTGSNGSFVYARQHYDYGQRVASQTIPAYGNSSPDFLTDSQLSWKYADTHRSTTFQYDALDRVITEKGPGDEWHASNRFRHTAYLLNGAGEVKLYRVSSNTLQQSGYYPAGRLYVEEYTDEDQNPTRIYKDMQGRTVMQRQGSDSDTYYVYDAAGNLRYVLPPAASAGLSGGSWTMASSAVLQQFAYYYEYDSRARCTRKQLPGCDYVTMTYDTNDRLVTSQDGNQRLSNVSTYYEYDNLGRQTVMGVDTAGVRTPLLETFYDDYTFLTSEESAKVGFNASGGYHSSYASARGLQTGSRVHHLEKTSLYEVTAMYYDPLGNMIQQRSTNHLSGNDDVYIQYNEYTGAELQRRHVHSASGKPTRTELYTNTYDYAGRLQSVSHKLGDNAPVTLCSMTYDEYGRLASKAIGGNVQSVSYSYNIRDWVTSVSSTHFSEQLAYAGTNGAASAATPRFNGNIAAMAWKAGTETAYRNFQFSYNAKGWLTSATYSGTGSYNTQYQYDTMGNITSLQRYGLQDNSQYGLIDNLSYTYNGNQLVTVTDAVSGPNYSGAFHFRDGADEDSEYEYDQNGNLTKDLNKKITQIKYNLLNLPSMITYNSNKDYKFVYDATGRKLSAVFGTTEAYVGPVTPFPHGITLIDEPMADITSPLGGGLGSHPVIGDSAYVNPGHGGQWGELLIDQNFQYCGNIFYSNGKVNRIFFDGGYVTFTNSQPVYHYYLQDHLGNNRVVVNQNDSVEQVNHYYPFGALFGESTGGDKNRYKYNGKELDRLNGIDLYDYGARHLDAALGRWSTIDPMAEKYYNLSPYNYCGNNPIKFVDPDGTYVVDSIMQNNSTYGTVMVMSIDFRNKRSDYNGALYRDYIAAQHAGLPIILVDGVNDFADALSELQERNINVNTFSINSHGTAGNSTNPAHFYIGFDAITSTTDVSALNEGLEGRYVFINACNVGAEDGNKLITNFSSQTGSTVIASQHPIYSSYKFDGSLKLNYNPLYNNSNLYSISSKGAQAHTITDVRMTKLRGVSWNFNSTSPYQYNIKRTVPWK